MYNEYKPGDVLVFGAKDAFGKAIAYLTDSDVSHTALVYDEGHLVQMGDEGIVKTKMNDYSERTVYHLRHKTETDMTKVIKAADFYLEKEIKYDNPSLVVLGGLLIYHRNSYTPEYKAIVDTILGIACWSLDKLLNRIFLGEDNQAMMCSQFVYQCFYDIGGNYRIKIKDGVVWHGKRKDSGICLIDLLEKTKELPIFHTPNYDEKDINEERLAQKLYDALTDKVQTGEYLTSAELTDTLSKARKFLDLLEKILETLGSHMPLPSLFVTPADLCYHAENLETLAD